MKSRVNVFTILLSLLLLILIFVSSQIVEVPFQVAKANASFGQSTLDPASNSDFPSDQSHSLFTLFLPTVGINFELKQTLPYLQLAPMTHLDVAPEDKQLTAYGQDFCTDSNCSPVSIKVGDHVVIRDIKVGEFGTFAVPLTISELVGEYSVTAYQTLSDGTVLEASLPLVVPVGDEEEEPQEPPSPSASSSSLPSAQINSISSVSEFQPNIFWGGRTVAVAIDPSNPTVVLAATESGGVFKSTDGGTTWSHVGTLPSFRLSDLRVDPNNAQNVIVTANSDSRTINGAGIWRSTDGGATWQKPATADPPPSPFCSSRFQAWGIDYVVGSGDVFVGTDCGVAISNDSGATWTHVVPDATSTNRTVFAITAQPGGPSGSIVDICAADGHHRSTDGGLNWTPTSTALPGCMGAATHAIAGSPLEPNVVFATTTGPVIACGSGMAVSIVLYESDDGGASWNQIKSDPCPNRPPAVRTTLSRDGDPQHIDVYYSNGANTVRQTCVNTGGPGQRCTTTWDTFSYDHSDHMDVAFNPADNCPIYMASDAGVHTTSDCGTNWTITGVGNGGYNALQVYEMTGQTHPDHTDLYFGTQDNDIWASADNGVSWPNRVRFEGFFLQIPHSSPSDTGQTLTGVACGPCGNFMTGAHLTSQTPWNNPPGGGGNPFLIEPDVYIQFSQSSPPTNTLYLSTNTGGMWNPVPGGVVNQQLSGRPYIAGPPATPTIYQTIAKPGNIISLIKITGVRGGTATITPADTGLNNIGRYCMGQGTFVCPRVFGVDPNDAQHLFAADVGTNQVKVSTNGGDTWEADNLLTNLVIGEGQFLFSGQNSPLQVHVFTFDPTNGNRILVGTEAAGIFASLDGGLTWSRITNSEQIVNVSSFFFDEVNNTVFASSYGRGLWELSLELPVADAGGPYDTDEGVDVVLDGSGSSDPGGSTLTYEWDLDNDGQFDDATGPNPIFDMVGQDGVYSIALKVTAGDGDFTVAASTVTVNNVAPVVVIGSDAPVDENSPVTVNGKISDPGWLDFLTATIDWGDGTLVENIIGDLENDRPDAVLTFSVEHVYGDNGVFTATVCGFDDDTVTCEKTLIRVDNINPTTEIDETGTTLINGLPTFLAHAGDPVDFNGRSTDPGSDDLFLSWDWDDGPPSPDVTTVYLVNPSIGPDPYPSPSIQPRDVTDMQTHSFDNACLYLIRFLAEDDDGGISFDDAYVLITGNVDRTRSEGYWQHQFHRVGNTDFTEEELECYLEIIGFVSTVFNEDRDASTIETAYDVLFLQENHGSEAEQFDRELLTVWLNFANGALDYDQLIDTDKDGIPDTQLAVIVAAAEAVRLDPLVTPIELREQTQILHLLWVDN